MPYGNNYLQQVPQINQNGSYYGQQSYAQPMSQPAYPQNQTVMRTQWVDGEGSARAYQMPPGWMPNEPIALWDMNDQVIYMKSFNNMGMPNPLKKIRYTVEPDESSYNLMSGAGNPPMPNGDYVTKADFNQLKEELMASVQSAMHSGANSQKPAQQMNNRNGGGRE